jgi:hypothetical protein
MRSLVKWVFSNGGANTTHTRLDTNSFENTPGLTETISANEGKLGHKP